MPCVIEILVKQTRGSAPREAGTRMWVSAAEARGTIGGGNLEYKALAIAREMLHSGEARRERRFVLGDALGQCCGGNVTLLFTTVADFPTEAASDFQIVLFGAGHVGKELARILGRLPCRLTWVDPRPDAFPATVDANTTVLIEDEPSWAVDDAPANTCFLVMTHSHALDFDIVERVLKRSDYRFLGLIGSETKAAKFRARLTRKRLAAERLVCPIGIVKAGKHPAEVAVSIAAQLIALAPSVPAARAPLRSSA
jgi:xanthine dehydrogenase accessory factor